MVVFTFASRAGRKSRTSPTHPAWQEDIDRLANGLQRARSWIVFPVALSMTTSVKAGARARPPTRQPCIIRLDPVRIGSVAVRGVDV